jgi:hypothetical protein
MMKYKSKAEIFSLESAKKYIKTEQSAQKWEHRTILPEKSKAVKKKKKGPSPERRSGPGRGRAQARRKLCRKSRWNW